jgi:hypothetical protein
LQLGVLLQLWLRCYKPVGIRDVGAEASKQTNHAVCHLLLLLLLFLFLLLLLLLLFLLLLLLLLLLFLLVVVLLLQGSRCGPDRECWDQYHGGTCCPHLAGRCTPAHAAGCVRGGSSSSSWRGR